MCQMRREVNAEADGDDDVGGGHDVDGQTPEVHEPADVSLHFQSK